MMGRIANFIEGPIPKAPAKRPVVRRERDKDYLGWLHRLPCVVSGVTNDVIAHHLTIGRGRMGVKEDDSLALPLAAYLHDQHSDALHVIGERNFWNRWGFEPFDLCRDLRAFYEQHEGRIAGAGTIIQGHRYLAQRRVDAGLKLFDERSAA